MGLSVIAEDLGLTIDGHVILAGANLEVPAGSIVTIMGISGSGKTSLLRCLAGLVRPTSGRVLVGDLELTGMTEDQLNRRRGRMGMVFQYSALFDSLNVFDNIAFGLKYNSKLTPAEIQDRVAELLEAVGLEGTEDRLPAQLSGGMRKRVSLARALAPRPEVVFYDEPTSGLDPIVTSLMNELIRTVRQREGVTSVVVTHDVESAMAISDQLALLGDGRILASGTPAQMRESDDPALKQFLSGSPTGPIHVTA